MSFIIAPELDNTWSRVYFLTRSEKHYLADKISDNFASFFELWSKVSCRVSYSLDIENNGSYLLLDRYPYSFFIAHDDVDTLLHTLATADLDQSHSIACHFKDEFLSYLICAFFDLYCESLERKKKIDLDKEVLKEFNVSFKENVDLCSCDNFFDRQNFFVFTIHVDSLPIIVSLSYKNLRWFDLRPLNSNSDLSSKDELLSSVKHNLDIFISQDVLPLAQMISLKDEDILLLSKDFKLEVKSQGSSVFSAKFNGSGEDRSLVIE